MFSRDSGRPSVLCLFQLLVAACISWRVATSIQSSKPVSLNLCLLFLHTTFSCVCACMCVVKFPCFTLMKTFMMAFRTHLDDPGCLLHLKVLNTSAKIFPPKMVTFIGSRDSWGAFLSLLQMCKPKYTLKRGHKCLSFNLQRRPTQWPKHWTEKRGWRV